MYAEVTTDQKLATWLGRSLHCDTVMLDIALNKLLLFKFNLEKG